MIHLIHCSQVFIYIMKKKHTLDTLAGRIGVIYARYSSHMQNDTSIEQQVEKCTEYAARQGITLLRTYADRAMTGRNDRRPEFQKMLRDAEKHEFNVVVAWKSNRMGRNMVEALVNDARLLDHGVDTRYVEEDFDDSAAGRFALRSMMNLNQFYSENMAEDIRRGLNDAARKGQALSRPPLGYKRDRDTGRFVIVETDALIVREIFDRVLRGESYAEIMDSFNARNLKTRRGNAFNKNSFAKILRNRKYIGEFKWDDVVIPDGMPAIIDRDVFEAVQRRLDYKGEVTGRRFDTVRYLLTGKLFCGHCGEMMSGYCGTGKLGRKYHYYVCAGRKAKVCDKKNVRKDTLELLVARVLCEQVLTDEVINWMADHILAEQEKLAAESMLAVYEGQLKDNKAAYDNLLSAIEKGLSGAKVNARIAELEEEEAHLQVLIDKEKSLRSNLTREMIQFYFEQFRVGDINDEKMQEQLFRTFLKKVYLYDDKIRIGFNNVRNGEFLEDDECEVDVAEGFDQGMLCSTIGIRDEHLRFWFTGSVVWVEKRLR